MVLVYERHLMLGEIIESFIKNVELKQEKGLFLSTVFILAAFSV